MFKKKDKDKDKEKDKEKEKKEEAEIQELVRTLKSTSTSAHQKANSATVLRSLVWDEEKHQQVYEAGAIPILCQLLNENVKLNQDEKIPLWESCSLCLRSLSYYKSEYRHAIAQNGGIERLTDLLSYTSDCKENSGLCLANLAKEPTLRSRIFSSGAVDKLVKILEKEGHDLHPFVRACHALYYLTLDPDIRDYVAKADFVNYILKVVNELDNFDAFSMMMLISNVVDMERGAFKLSNSNLVPQFESGIGDCLRGKKNMFDIGDISLSIKRLSSSDDNKEFIGKGRIIQLLLLTLTSEESSVRDKEGATGALWALSFNLENLKTMKKFNSDQIIPNLVHHEGQVGKNAQGIMWQFELASQAEKAKNEPQNAPKDPKTTQSTQATSQSTLVMLSYNWKHQKKVLEIRETLRKRGVDVWIDVEQMRGHTLEAMANAVDTSSIVVICLSRLYFESPNCRAEADYAFVRKKKIIPVIVEKDYRPEGWLGMIVGSKLYYDVTSASIADFEDKMKGLTEEIMSTDSFRTTNAKTGSMSTTSPSGAVQKEKKPSTMSQVEIEEWLKEQGLLNLKEIFLANKIEGNALEEMKRLAMDHPSTLYQNILPALGILQIGQQLSLVHKLLKL